MIIPQNISGLNVILIGAATATIGSILVQLREYPKKVIDFILERFTFVATIYQFDSFYRIVEEYMNLRHKNSFSNISINTAFTKDDNKVDKFAISHLRGTVFIKHKGKIIRIIKEREKFENSNQAIGGYVDYYCFKGWKARNQILDLINEMLLSHKEENSKDKIRVYSNDSWCWFEVNILKTKPVQSVILDQGIKDVLISDIQEFLNSEAWYSERGIPYKRTALLYGEPGNGKTSLALALALYFKKDICLLNINNIQTDGNLRDVFSKIKSNTILLIEDCDKLFDERDAKTKISFSTFINCMDGALYKSGLITIMTTNHIDKLDPAILREGRIDRKIEIKNPSSELIKEYVCGFYNSNHISIVASGGMPMSKVQEICLTNKGDKQNAIDIINSTKQIAA